MDEQFVYSDFPDDIKCDDEIKLLTNLPMSEINELTKILTTPKMLAVLKVANRIGIAGFKIISVLRYERKLEEHKCTNIGFHFKTQRIKDE